MIKGNNTINMKVLGDSTKNILHHAVSNCKESKVPHKQCKTHSTKRVYKTMRNVIKSMKCSNQHKVDNIHKTEVTHMITIKCHKEYEVFKPTQSRQYPQDRSDTYDNHKQFKQIAQLTKDNRFESTKNTHKVHCIKPKKIITKWV